MVTFSARQCHFARATSNAGFSKFYGDVGKDNRLTVQSKNSDTVYYLFINDGKSDRKLPQSKKIASVIQLMKLFSITKKF